MSPILRDKLSRRSFFFVLLALALSALMNVAILHLISRYSVAAIVEQLRFFSAESLGPILKMFLGNIPLNLPSVSSLENKVAHAEQARFFYTICAMVIAQVIAAVLLFAVIAGAFRFRRPGSWSVGGLGRMKSEFFTNMSHEMKTPLAGIIGLSEELESSESNEERKHSLGIIRKSGQNMLHLVNEVLDLFRLESGRMVLHPSHVNIADIVEEAAATVRTQCAEKGVELKVVISDDLRKVVNADGHKLSRVLINLLSNAQKCTERGSILLEAASNRSSKRGDIIFSVKDSGSGISSERINDIVRGISISSEINSKQGEEGTGLGLPISVGLVSLMGGELWVESEVGRGSSFYFTIKTLNDA
ncbi:MAG TPA: HAMP domain-containing sensor histidine kinase [bacterium]|nr:hypothetical protein [Myxococcales bacterium]HPW45943.1 HAMP domain-containing sensor histidine kinase [bacterium]